MYDINVHVVFSVSIEASEVQKCNYNIMQKMQTDEVLRGLWHNVFCEINL